MRGSDRYFLICAVYSWSIFCVACANAVVACDSTPAATNAVLHRRIEAVERDILAPCAKKREFRETRNGGMDVMSGTSGAVCDLASSTLICEVALWRQGKLMTELTASGPVIRNTRMCGLIWHAAIQGV